MTLCYASKTQWHDLLRQSAETKTLHLQQPQRTGGRSLSRTSSKMASLVGATTKQAPQLGLNLSVHISVFEECRLSPAGLAEKATEAHLFSLHLGWWCQALNVESPLKSPLEKLDVFLCVCNSFIFYTGSSSLGGVWQGMWRVTGISGGENHRYHSNLGTTTLT